VAPPTTQRVAELIEGMGLRADEVVGRIPPGGGVATAREVAVQCAMAGCRGEEGRIVAAALRLMLEDDFNLNGIQCTTNPCAPLVIISGPITKSPGFNHGHGAFSGGGRANVAIGRAVRLVLWNLGRARPGDNDMSPLGHPAKFSFCVSENPDVEGWSPIHTDFGIAPDVDAITILACCGPSPVAFTPEAESVLNVLAESLPSTDFNAFHAAGQVLVVLAENAARLLADAGFDRTSLKRWLWENARYDISRLREYNLVDMYWRVNGLAPHRPDMHSLPDGTKLPMVLSENDFLLLITGGDTQMWGGFCAGWGNFGGAPRARPIAGSLVEEPAGELVS
jgi:hypothetical protein